MFRRTSVLGTQGHGTQEQRNTGWTTGHKVTGHTNTRTHTQRKNPVQMWSKKTKVTKKKPKHMPSMQQTATTHTTNQQPSPTRKRTHEQLPHMPRPTNPQMWHAGRSPPAPLDNAARRLARPRFWWLVASRMFWSPTRLLGHASLIGWRPCRARLGLVSVLTMPGIDILSA